MYNKPYNQESTIHYLSLLRVGGENVLFSPIEI